MDNSIRNILLLGLPELLSKFHPIQSDLLEKYYSVRYNFYIEYIGAMMSKDKSVMRRLTNLYAKAEAKRNVAKKAIKEIRRAIRGIILQAIDAATDEKGRVDEEKKATNIAAAYQEISKYLAKNLFTNHLKVVFNNSPAATFQPLANLEGDVGDAAQAYIDNKGDVTLDHLVTKIIQEFERIKLEDPNNKSLNTVSDEMVIGAMKGSSDNVNKMLNVLKEFRAKKTGGATGEEIVASLQRFGTLMKRCTGEMKDAPSNHVKYNLEIYEDLMAARTEIEGMVKQPAKHARSLATSPSLTPDIPVTPSPVVSPILVSPSVNLPASPNGAQLVGNTSLPATLSPGSTSPTEIGSKTMGSVPPHEDKEDDTEEEQNVLASLVLLLSNGSALTEKTDESTPNPYDYVVRNLVKAATEIVNYGMYGVNIMYITKNYELQSNVTKLSEFAKKIGVIIGSVIKMIEKKDSTQSAFDKIDGDVRKIADLAKTTFAALEAKGKRESAAYSITRTGDTVSLPEAMTNDDVAIATESGSQTNKFIEALIHVLHKLKIQTSLRTSNEGKETEKLKKDTTGGGNRRLYTYLQISEGGADFDYDASSFSRVFSGGDSYAEIAKKSDEIIDNLKANHHVVVSNYHLNRSRKTSAQIRRVLLNIIDDMKVKRVKLVVHEVFDDYASPLKHRKRTFVDDISGLSDALAKWDDISSHVIFTFTLDQQVKLVYVDLANISAQTKSVADFRNDIIDGKHSGIIMKTVIEGLKDDDFVAVLFTIIENKKNENSGKSDRYSNSDNGEEGSGSESDGESNTKGDQLGGETFLGDRDDTFYTKLLTEISPDMSHKEKEQLIFRLDEDDTHSPSINKLTPMDRIIFIGVTFVLRLMAVFLTQWGLQTNMLYSFTTAFAFYVNVYIILFLLWVALANSSRLFDTAGAGDFAYMMTTITYLFRTMFWYISSDDSRMRIIIHIIIQIMLLPIPFIIGGNDIMSTVPTPDLTFKEKRALIETISNFSLFIWLFSAAVAVVL